MRYRAFISYSSADRVVGERFQRALERYRIPKPLRGQDRGAGPIPKYLTPVYRDRSDASTSADLSTELGDALADSEALIPLCSPESARSKWVNTEIRRFKALGRGDRVFPVLIAGRPVRHDARDAADGAFPPALFERVDVNGTVVGDTGAVPLAADIRPDGDGFDVARLKVVAGLTGVPLTELTQRHMAAERRERRIFRAVAAVMTGLTIAVAVVAVAAYLAADAARTRLSKAIEMAARRVDDGAKYADQYGVPIEVVRELLAGARRDFAELIGDDDTRVPMADLQRGRLMLLFSRLHGLLGESADQLSSARRGVDTLARVPSARRWSAPSTWFADLPSHEQVVGEQLAGVETLALAMANAGHDAAEVWATLERGRDAADRAGRPDLVSRFWSRISELHYGLGDVEKARAAQDAAIAAFDAHVAGVPTAERGAALSDRAKLLLESERHQEALADQQEAARIFERDALARPDDAAAQQRLGQALARYADSVYAVTGDWTEPQHALERAEIVLGRLAERDPSRVDFHRDRLTVVERLGDSMLQTNRVALAQSYFERLIEGRRRLFQRDPASPENRRDLAVALERQADIELALNRPQQALTFLDEARGLRAPAGGVGTPDSRDLVLIRDLAVLWAKTGSARSAARVQSWREAFETAIGLMVPIVDAGDAPSGWRQDVALFRGLYGNALESAGDRARARTQWAAALVLVEEQLRERPEDPRLAADRRELQGRLKK